MGGGGGLKSTYRDDSGICNEYTLLLKHYDKRSTNQGAHHPMHCPIIRWLQVITCGHFMRSFSSYNWHYTNNIYVCRSQIRKFKGDVEFSPWGRHRLTESKPFW